MPSNSPLVSIILPAYRSEETIAANLRTLCAQTYASLEIVVIDSSPDDECERIVGAEFPGVCYLHNKKRLIPHAARNLGVQLARGELLLFTDPDIYAPPGWAAALVEVHLARGGVVTSALNCYQHCWVEVGMHLCKFDKWLPGGELRKIDIAPTASLLCSRKDFDAVGGFKDGYMLSDTLMSWAFTDAGIPIWFVPFILVEHHHTGNWWQMLSERFSRGAEFALLRMEREGWKRGRILGQFLASVLPVRLIKILARSARNARQAGLARDYLSCGPVIASGQAAWLAGEAAGYWQAILQQS